MHLLHVEDFQSFGIGLADGRLLIEKFKLQTRTAELIQMVSAVRGGKHLPHSKKGDNAQMNVEFTWHSWNSKKKDYTMVRLSNGGGVRKKEYGKTTKLECICEDSKKIYFPNGKNKTGYLKLKNVRFFGGDMEEISNLDCTIEEYVKSKALKLGKFVLKSKPLSIISMKHSSESDYESDYDHSTPKYSRGSKFRKPSIAVKDESSDSDFEIPWHKTLTKPKKSKMIEDRGKLIKEQDEAYETSLEFDQLKSKHKKEEEERIEYLQKKQLHRKSLVPVEPGLNEDCVLIVIRHVSLGRIERFFKSTDSFQMVYYWVGSLSPEPELFSLNLGHERTVIQPEESVVTAERQVVLMNEMVNSNFTFDIIDLDSLSNQHDNIPDRQSNQLLNCPVCNGKFSVTEIEFYATHCADNKFIETIEESEDDIEENNMHANVPVVCKDSQVHGMETMFQWYARTVKYMIREQCSSGMQGQSSTWYGNNVPVVCKDSQVHDTGTMFQWYARTVKYMIWKQCSSGMQGQSST